MTEHSVLERYHPSTRLLTLSTWSIQGHVVARSDEVAASIVRHAPSSRVPVTVVRNGVDVDRFVVDGQQRHKLRARLGIALTAPVVGTVAVLRTQEALDRWLRVAQAVVARVPAARFVTVGDGPMRSELEALSSSLELFDLVSFVGVQSDPVPWLAAMDMWLSTSAFEGLPLALLEALAAERAVVATAVGGVPEVVVDHENGRLLKADEEAGLVDVVCAFCVDRDGARRAGVAGRAVAEKQFGIRQMQERLLGVYRSVLS